MIRLDGEYSPLVIKEDRAKRKLSCDINKERERLNFYMFDDRGYIVEIVMINGEDNGRRILYSENGNKKIITSHLNYDFDADNLELDIWGTRKRELGNLVFSHIRGAELSRRHYEMIDGEILVRKSLLEHAAYSYSQVLRYLEEKQRNFIRKSV